MDALIIKVKIAINAQITMNLSMEVALFETVFNGKAIDVLFVKVDLT